MEYKKCSLTAGLNEHCYINENKHKNIAIYWKFSIDSPYIKTEILTYDEYNNSVKKVRGYDSIKHYFTYDTLNLNPEQKNELNNVSTTCENLWSFERKHDSRRIIKINFFVPEDCEVELCCFELSE